MESNPYKGLPPSAFWKTGVTQENPYLVQGIYKRKFTIPPGAKIATAGSCFAQHISRQLKNNGYNVLDVEAAPEGLPENLHHKYGYSMYSARYGNIYTVKQLLQLAQEAAGVWAPDNYIWEKDGKFFDAFRPAIDPEGLSSPEEVIESRRLHIARVKELFEELDLLIFTLGLTEMWIHNETGTVFPTAPGTIAGDFDEKAYKFKNAEFFEIISDFSKFQQEIRSIRGGKPFKILLTVSPVPLTATASGKHILVSTTYSKSILRSVAGQLATNQGNIDYFPSFEIVNNPRLHSTSFADNLRSVREEAVENVMRHFFREHPPLVSHQTTPHDAVDEDIQCEEALLEAFVNTSLTFNPEQIHSKENSEHSYLEVIGNSHLAGFMMAIPPDNKHQFACIPRHWVNRFRKLTKLELHDFTPPISTSDIVKEHQFDVMIPHSAHRCGILLVGLGLMGEGLIQCFGPLKAGYKKADGSLPKGFEISPKIPIISGPSECSQHIVDLFIENVQRAKLVLNSLSRVSSVDKFYWICSPMPTEKSARYRFGDEYVDSGSQVYYNNVYIELMRKHLRIEIESNVVLMHDESTLTASGFTKDEFKAKEDIFGIHANANLYSPLVSYLLKKL